MLPTKIKGRESVRLSRKVSVILDIKFSMLQIFYAVFSVICNDCSNFC